MCVPVVCALMQSVSEGVGGCVHMWVGVHVYVSVCMYMHECAVCVYLSSVCLACI